MATEDAAYRQSSQYRFWSFSPSQLADLRHKTNALATASISDRLASRPQATAAANSSAPASGANTPSQQSQAQPSQTQNDDPIEYLTPAEEILLLNFYIVELLRAGKYLELPTEVLSTAAVFFRRFYLTNSIMTYPPTDMLKTSLFFGAKAEGYYNKLRDFADKMPNTKPAQILAGEFLLCQGIRFTFDVKHPFLALEGAIMELRRYGDVDEGRISEAHGRARQILKFSPLLTDAYFHYTPSQIMLAALALADGDLADKIVQETFGHIKEEEEEDKVGKNGVKKEETAERIFAADIKNKVLATLKSCQEMLNAEPPERADEYWPKAEADNILRPLRKKLRRCRDPDRWDLVALQASKMEGAVKKPAQNKSLEEDGAVFGAGESSGVASGDGDKRDAKRRKVEDPFGGPLKGR